jgi:SAM-dependent methyltransferase
MKNRYKWRAYSELAWTEPIIAQPDDYAKDTELFSNVIKEHSKIEVKTLLHLGCGAGGNDYTFKEYFKLTGVDVSENMLEIARRINPEAVYYHGDMRTIELGECFDAVAVPDSIGYMTTEKELRRAIVTGQNHLKPGGVLLIVANIREEFRENNFVYTGSKGDLEITVFENNHIPNPAGTTYEATFIYLIRRRGKLEIHTDCHTMGIFKLETWLDLLKEMGFDDVNQIKMEHSYDRFLLGEGKYPLLMLVCGKLL